MPSIDAVIPNDTAGDRLPPAKPTSNKLNKPSELPSRSGSTKTELVLKKLRAAKGASIEQLMEATDWQPHSVRGFLSAIVRKKLGLNLTSGVGKDGVRRYRIVAAGEGA